jgi:hypothetical protein
MHMTTSTKVVAPFVALLALIFAAPGIATEYTSEATVLATFSCPEALPSDDARAAELKAYLAWMTVQHPDWVLAKTTGHRLYLLERHNCQKTIERIQATKSIH